MISRIFEGNRGSVQYFPAGKCRPGVDLRARERPPNRVPKCDVIENEICEIMGFVKLF